MRYFVLSLAPALFAVSIVFAQSPNDHAQDRAYIVKSERDWAASVVNHDLSVIERILAEDFVGVWIDGSNYSKADEIKDYRSMPLHYLSDHTNEVAVRFYGHAAIAQGSESWKKKDGAQGSFVWTDTWIERNGKWQIVQAQDLEAPAGYQPRGK